MYELRVTHEFPAAHHLEGYPGDCARPHGHNWVIEVFARSHGLDSLGMAVDFRSLKGAVKEIAQAWDHQDLNLVEDFKGVNPSAEQMARIAFEKLATLMGSNPKTKGTWIDRITIWENPRSSASYWPDRGQESFQGPRS